MRYGLRVRAEYQGSRVHFLLVPVWLVNQLEVDGVIGDVRLFEGESDSVRVWRFLDGVER